MVDMHEVTVVITAYNLEKYIGSCLDELLNQTYQNFKILLVDDCSKDATSEIISGYMSEYPDKINFICLNQNLGLPARARNYSIDSGYIASPYVIFLDGDDSIEPFFLEKLYNSITEFDSDVAVCAYDRIVSETGQVLSTEMRGFPDFIDLLQVEDELAFLNGSMWNRLWKYEVIKGLRFPDFSVGEDLFFQVQCYLNSSRISFVDDVLIHYRVRKESVISNTSQNSITSFADQFKMLYEKVKGTKQSDWLELVIFIHIGISMLFRAAANPDIRLVNHIKWTKKYFVNNFGMFGKNKYFRLNSLCKHGIRGLAIWLVLFMYKLGGLALFAKTYNWMVKTFHFEVKF